MNKDKDGDDGYDTSMVGRKANAPAVNVKKLY